MRLLILFIALAVAGSSFAQGSKKKDLESKKKKIQQDIEYQNRLLNEVKKNKNRSMVQLAILNNKINKQKDLISTINRELGVIDQQIKDTQYEITLKEEELKKLKGNYARLIKSSYRNRDTYSRLMFLFSSQDFNQAMLRVKYMQYYSEARRKQAKKINEAYRQLQTHQQELELKKQEQTQSLSEKEAESGTLTKQKQEKESTLSGLQKREKDIRAQIKEKKAQADKLKKAIEKVISEELAKAKSAGKKSKSITLTPEEKELSQSFASNKGKLPWPLVKGVITETFGKHKHPDLPSVVINNNGVDIATHQGSAVRAVFSGVVVAVAAVGGLEGKVVIIKHGEYLSVYSNLESTSVKQGQSVETKQEIGRVLTNDESVTELHFEIWKGQEMMDPESWIAG